MDRLTKLRVLESELREAMDVASSRDMAALSRQYRETLREIEELEGEDDDGDEIAGIIAKRNPKR